MEIRLFGLVEVRVAGVPVDAGQPRQRCVLAALAADIGHAVPVTTLIERVWGEQPPRRARDALYVYLGGIRKLTERSDGARLIRRSGGYLLDMDPERVDVHRFGRLVGLARDPKCPDDQRAALLRQALDLWHGTPLGDLSGDWAAQVRQAWHGTYLDTMVRWADTSIRTGDAAVTVQPLTELVELHPLNEPLAAVLMRALHATGRVADALSRYTRTRDVLVEQLGIEPSAELRQVHQAVLRGETTTPAPPSGTAPVRAVAATPAQLPGDVPGFRGRRAELAVLDTVPERLRLIVIAGTPGVGKTALAIHWAHRVAGQFGDGQLYLNLRGFGPSRSAATPAESVRTLLDALGVDADRIPTDLDAQLGLYRTMLAGKRMLIVLDNAGTVDQVRPLLPGTGDSFVIVTSRHRLTGLVARNGALAMSLDVLPEADAVDVIDQVLGDRAASDPDAARELAQICGGLPLALRVAAAAAATSNVDLSAYVAAVRSGDRLDALRIEHDDESAVPVAFDHSYARLAPAEKRAFRLLGLVPGPDFTTEAAVALIGAEHATAGRYLARLVEANVVQPHLAGRYRLHDLLRLYAAARAAEQAGDERAQALTRLFDFYAGHADAAVRTVLPHAVRQPVFEGPQGAFTGVDEAMAWLDRERANLVAITELAAQEGAYRTTTVLTSALRGYFRLGRHDSEWKRVGEAGLAAGEASGDDLALACAEMCLAQWAYHRADYASQLAYGTAAVEHAHRAGWSHGEVAAAVDAGNAELKLGRVADAAERYQRVSRVSTEIGLAAGINAASVNLAIIYQQLGRLVEARDQLIRVLASERANGDALGIAQTLINIADLAVDLGQLTEAREAIDEALEILRTVDGVYFEALALSILAAAYREEGRLAEALAAAERAVELVSTTGDRQIEGRVRLAVGTVWHALDRLDLAEPAVRQALDIARDTESPDLGISVLNELADILCSAGRTAEAITLADEALKLSDGRYRILEGTALAVLARAHLRDGDDETGRDLALRALEIQDATGERLRASRTRRLLAA